MVLRNQKGSVTLYLLIIFMAMVIFIGLFVDLARIKVAQNQLRRVLNASARSVMADYDASLKEKYHLFAYSGHGEPKSEDFKKYLALNLSSSPEQNFFLFDYKIENYNVSFLSHAKDLNVLKQQILEQMKYKAPIEITANLIDKFDVINKLKELFSDQSRAREKQSLRDEELSKINQRNKDIRRLKEILKNEQEQIKKYTELIDEQKALIKLTEASLASAQDEASKKSIEEQLAQQKKDLENLKKVREGYIRSAEDTKNLLNNYLEENIKSIERGIDLESDIENLAKSRNVELNYDGQNEKIDTAKYESKAAHLEQIKKNLIAAKEFLNNIQPTSDPKQTDGLNDYIDPADNTCNSIISQPHQASTENHKHHDEENTDEYKKLEDLVKGEQAQGNTYNDETENNFNQRSSSLTKTFNWITEIKKASLGFRDNVFINEYILSYFTNYTDEADQSCEIEQIITNQGKESAIRTVTLKIFGYRFALDVLGYSLLDPAAPPELLSRAVYALLMGGIQATLDTYYLLKGKDVGIIEISLSPAAASISEKLEKVLPTLNYKDYLRIFLLENSDQNAKLSRIKMIINQKTDNALEKGTSIRGNATVSIRLWFLPLAGIKSIDNGPFGTRIQDGRCYITKAVEYAY